MQIYSRAGKQMLKDVRWLMSVVNVESKFLDTTINSSPDNSTPVIVALTLMAQGETSQTRSGDSVKAQALCMNLSINMNPTSVTQHTRVLIVEDKASNGSAPSWSQVIRQTSPSGFYNLDNSDRFIVHLDQHFINNAQAKELTGKYNWTQQLNQHVRYSGTGATQGEATTGHMYLLMLSSEPTYPATVSGYIRFLFVDN
jgi:hypothetical protein